MVTFGRHSSCFASMSKNTTKYIHKNKIQTRVTRRYCCVAICFLILCLCVYFAVLLERLWKLPLHTSKLMPHPFNDTMSLPQLNNNIYNCILSQLIYHVEIPNIGHMVKSEPIGQHYAQYKSGIIFRVTRVTWDQVSHLISHKRLWGNNWNYSFRNI